MLEEVRWASHFLARTCCPAEAQPPFRDAFAGEVEGTLLTRYQGHWDLRYPILGSGYRCVTDRDVGLLMRAAKDAAAAAVVGGSPPLTLTLPEVGFALWVDPGCVSWRFRGAGPPEGQWTLGEPVSVPPQPQSQSQSLQQQQHPIPADNPTLPPRPMTPDPNAHLKRQLQDTFKAKIQQQLLVSASLTSIKNQGDSPSVSFSGAGASANIPIV
jgi:hypothetical protein